MSWNYRIFKTRYRVKLRGKEDIFEEVFTIREVYYEDAESKGPIIAISKGDYGSSASGNTADELWKDLQKMNIAFQKPILSSYDIPGYEYEENEVPYDQGDMLE